jgi:hypothetical protein
MIPDCLHLSMEQPYPRITDPIIAEAMSLRDGVIFAKLRCFS